MNNILRHINYGYENIEPVIISMTALSKNFIMVGNHGTGKTKLAKFLSQGFDSDTTGNEGYVFYDATKDDLISIAGIPNPESMKEGRLDFVKHKRSIWDKFTIVVDEITRASKENQNLWLEILEEKTCFGLPLVYRSLIATANPDSYASANQLDEALLDRFYAVIPVPKLQHNLRSKEIREIVKINLKKNISDTTKIKSEIKSLFQNIQKEYTAYYENEAVLEAVERYAGQFISQLLIENSKTKDKTYISPRSYAKHFPDAIIVLASYYKALNIDKPLICGAEEAWTYCIATKFGFDKQMLMQIHDNYKTILNQNYNVNSTEYLRKEMAQLSTLSEKIRFLHTHYDKLQRLVKLDEIEYFIGSIVKRVEKNKEYLMDLYKAVSKLDDEFNNQKEYIKGTLILNFHQSINDFTAYTSTHTLTDKQNKDNTKKIRGNINKIYNLAKKNILLKSTNEKHIKVSKFLLSLDYKDKDNIEQTLKDFLCEIEL